MLIGSNAIAVAQQRENQPGVAGSRSRATLHGADPVVSAAGSLRGKLEGLLDSPSGWVIATLDLEHPVR
jgi:hypothetical protein